MDTALNDIKNGDLYALLQNCSDEDLDPLVKIIIGRMTNFLDINEDYKKYQPKHSKYSKVIGDEIRSFGGNTFRNIFRGGGPSYSDIVIDVCKKLDIPFKKGCVVDNEKNILSICLERQWKSLSQKEQEEILAEARKKASKKADGFGTDFINNCGSVLISRLFLGRWGWGSVVFSFAGPSYKVIVSSVLYVAFLRGKYLERIRESSCSSIYEETDNTKEVVSERSPLLAIGTSQEEHLLTLARISMPRVQKWQSVSDNDQGISRLNPLLQAVPSIVVAGDVVASNYMEVVINGPLLKAKGQDGYRLIAMIDGKPSHGVLFEPSRLSSIVNGAALFQVASVVVAQKHLADISRKLSEIKETVERIERFQTKERRSELAGAISYFESEYKSLIPGQLSGDVRQQIENLEVKLLQVQKHLESDIEDECKKILTLNDRDGFGTEGMVRLIERQQKILDELFGDFLLCIHAHVCGWQLLTAFPGEEIRTKNRIDEIKTSAKLLDGDGNWMLAINDNMLKKIHELNSVWNSDKTLNKRKLSLLGWTDMFHNNVVSYKDEIVKYISAAEKVVFEQQYPTRIAVRVDQGKIIELCPL